MSHAKPLAIGALIATTATSLYLLVHEIFLKNKKQFTDKDSAALYLSKVSPRDLSVLQSFDADFVIAWANATVAGQGVFTYNGKQYLTATGTAMT